MFKFPHTNKYNKGVTLIELLVVIAIFMVISSITIFSYGKFNSSLSIQNLADDIALSIRRAQGYAIGVRGQSGSFEEQYGVHFTANPQTADVFAGSSKSFILFADINNINVYNYNSSQTCGSPVAGSECLEVLRIASADKIAGIYLNGSGSPITLTSSVDMVFKRPNPAPTFCYRSGNATSCSGGAISSVEIKIAQDTDPTISKTIYVSNNGQISISN